MFAIRVFMPDEENVSLRALALLRSFVRGRSAKSRVVLKVSATGGVTHTFAQVFSSEKLSLARKVKICDMSARAIRCLF